MRTQLMGLAVAATAITVLTGCNPGTTPTSSSTVKAGATGGFGSPSDVEPVSPPTVIGSTSAPKSTKTTPPTTTPATHKSSSAPSGAQISFTVAQKPKCAEGTAVFRAAPVPLIIKWKISHATSGALSVDDHSHTAGTYGPVDLTGTMEFSFGCNGSVGSTETHTYAIYSVGGGTQKSKTLTVSAKVLDNGKTGS
jgi:hypothetical protein